MRDSTGWLVSKAGMRLAMRKPLMRVGARASVLPLGGFSKNSYAITKRKENKQEHLTQTTKKLKLRKIR
jgi:hypothetical protein